MKQVTRTLAYLATLAAATTRIAHADGASFTEASESITGFLVVAGAIVVGLVFFAFIVSSTKRSERKMQDKFATKDAADLPAARVVDKRAD